jgi:hypothetical protein
LPGFDHKNASEEVYARKYAMLEHIRNEEAKKTHIISSGLYKLS